MPSREALKIEMAGRGHNGPILVGPGLIRTEVSDPCWNEMNQTDKLFRSLRFPPLRSYATDYRRIVLWYDRFLGRKMRGEHVSLVADADGIAAAYSFLYEVRTKYFVVP